MWRDLDAFAPPVPGWEKALKLGLIGGLHALLIGGALTMAVRPQMLETVKQISVRLIEEKPPAPPRIEPTPPKPLPQVQRPVLRREPPPVLTAAATEVQAPAPSFTVPLQPPPAPAEKVEPTAPPAPVAVTAASFEADYLHNPKPVYPPLSKRLGEQGRVILQVRVLADGSAAKLQVKSGSGFARLDEAALEAVSRWRFVPARRGDEAIDSWVLVPLAFALDR